MTAHPGECPETEVPVLIVGGSLTGLSAAVFLAHQGVRCTVVERRTGLGAHPRSRVLTARSGELLRSVGLEPAVEAVSRRPGGWFGARTLTDRTWTLLGGACDDTLRISPSGSRLCDQNMLEPVLLADAERNGATVRFGHELLGFDQDVHGVRATVVETATGRVRTVRCSYLLAADGTRSPVREALGVPLDGSRGRPAFLSAVFTADLDPALRGRRPTAVVLPGSDVLFARGTRGAPLWELCLHLDAGQLPDPAPRSAFVRARARAATGLPGLEPQVRTVLRWGSSAVVARTFSRGRVFLLGDAAHTMPVAGGLGGNTGIQDACNLAWRISAVQGGVACTSLLAGYDRERRPVAVRTLGHVLDTTRRRAGVPDPETVQLGHVYPEGDGPDSEDPYRPSGRPGSRAPHVALVHDGVPLSTLDLFGPGFTLLAGPRGRRWLAAAPDVTRRLGADVRGSLIAPDAGARALGDVADTFHERYGIGPEGAVLVRPDGHVGWRSATAAADPAGILGGALRSMGWGRTSAS
ncbi:FAD-dependent monooxygenase [Streptomyces wuyuanensis]|uniref:FAD-dependent monooxygenase n=1 Tax=Streptomyces wuyuanensis TaxID=1196353 RepID=UPI0034253685